jgi:outer membrane receptor protein involved in Fe transport
VLEGATKSPLEFATITVLRQADSSLVTGGITEKDGTFSIEVEYGQFFVKVEFLSFSAKTIGGVVLSREKPMFDLGKIMLEADAEVLQEIEVRAERSQMQLSLDKKVFNVGKDLANTGGSAADVLDNVPSVTVDVEGNVELRGAGGVRILIDGKPSGMVGLSNSDGLRQIPANMIDRVEVITNPSARYEAEGMSGIINIVLKKERKQGLNGSFDLKAGHPTDYGITFNLNYRKNRLNFFTNYGLSYDQRPGRGSLFQEFTRNDSLFITDNTSERTRGGISNNFRFGADYYFNEKNILTTAFNYRKSNDDNLVETRYDDYIFSLQNPVGITTRTDDEKENEDNLEYSLTYKKYFQEKGHELTVDFRYQDEVEDEQSQITERNFDTFFQPSGEADLLQRSRNEEKQRNMIFQADYLKPLGKEGKFEAGLRSGIRNLRNDFEVQELEDGAWVSLAQFTNSLIYDENIHAAYTSLGSKFNRFSWQLGLRAEYSDVTTELEQTQQINPRDYFDLFPSAFLGYEINPENTMQISYSRRIRRPGFWELNPFFTFSDARNIWGGNPDLDPEYTNSYEIGYLRYFTKGSLTSSVYYRHTEGVIERIREQTSDTTSFTFPTNLATRDDYGFEFTFSFDPTKTWRINGNANFFRSITEGEYGNQSFSADALTMFGRLSSRVTLFKKVDFQVNLNYRAPRNMPQGRAKSEWNIDPAASMDILKGNGTLTLAVRDLFNTRRRRFVTTGENFNVVGDHQWRVRQVNLTFTYRLNQKKKQGRGERGGGGFEGGGEDF